MKIYNEVVTQFNEITGEWETISEDSFNYNGIVHLAQGLPPGASALNEADKFADTIKTTAGYFTSNDGTMVGTDIFTGSLATVNEKYYFNINHKQDDGASADSTSETQFSVTFGHIDGSGSNQYGDSSNDPKTLVGETKAIYKQFTNLLLEENDARDGFKIASSSTVDKYIYVLIGKRDRFKDRINKKNWTLSLSGSTTAGAGVTLHLTDDSNTVSAMASPAGPRFNIVSGAGGSVHTAATDKTYGWFYPDRGVMVFSGTQLSASIPGQNSYALSASFTALTASAASSLTISGAIGTHDFTASLEQGDTIQLISESTAGNIYHKATIASIKSNPMEITIDKAWTTTDPTIDISAGTVGASGSTQLKLFKSDQLINNMTSSFETSTAGLTRYSSSGFAPNLNAQGNPKNALRFANCMRNLGSTNTLQLRSEEDKTEENYFCRVKASEYNFSTNPTFVSGSLNKIRNANMRGNPTTFISGVGLYNSAGQLLATAHLSKPIVKNFATETTIKVKLTY